MPKLPVIRNALPEDAETIHLFAEALYLEEGSPCNVTHAIVEAWLKDDRVRFLLAENDHPVGMAMFYFGYDLESGTRGAHLADIYVLPYARRCGMGRALIRELSDIVLKDGGEWVSLTVSKNNKMAHEFYSGMGLQDVRSKFLAMGKNALRTIVNEVQQD